MNCLVTKLKGVVKDKSIRKLGDLVIHVENTYGEKTVQLAPKQGKSITISITSGLLKIGSESAESFPINLNKSVVFPIGIYDIIINSKYDIDMFTNPGVALGDKICSFTIDSIEELNYIKGSNFNFWGVTFKIPNVSLLDRNDKMTKLYVGTSNMTGDINDIVKMYPNLYILDFTNSNNVYGKIDNIILSKAPNITDSTYFSVRNANNTTGSLDEFLSNNANSGKFVEGSILRFRGNNYTTYKGQLFSGEIYFVFTNGAFIER